MGRVRSGRARPDSYFYNPAQGLSALGGLRLDPDLVPGLKRRLLNFENESSNLNHNFKGFGLFRASMVSGQF